MNYINHLNYVLTDTNPYGDQTKYYHHPIFTNYCSNSNGDIVKITSDRITNIPQQPQNGYLQVVLSQGRMRKVYRAHRFVYECMNNRILNDDVEIDHIDRNRSNNRIDNLREVNRYTNVLNRFTNREVNELPIDSIKIIEYDGHHFTDLYYSPFTNCMYKYSESYLFEIPFKSRGRININGIRIHKNKLLSILGIDVDDDVSEE